jgi:hypothetical protein
MASTAVVTISTITSCIQKQQHVIRKFTCKRDVFADCQEGERVCRVDPQELVHGLLRNAVAERPEIAVLLKRQPRGQGDTSVPENKAVNNGSEKGDVVLIREPQQCARHNVIAVLSGRHRVDAGMGVQTAAAEGDIQQHKPSIVMCAYVIEA